MRISDWSSDVCSSDLVPATGYGAKLELRPPVGDSTEIRMGLDYREAVGRTNELYFFVGGLPTRARRAGGRNVTIGGFVEGSHALADGLVLTGGARLDRAQIQTRSEEHPSTPQSPMRST